MISAFVVFSNISTPLDRNKGIKVSAVRSSAKNLISAHDLDFRACLKFVFEICYEQFFSQTRRLLKAILE
jgi:hypothetical protein